MKPLVSIITVFYNEEKYLGELLSSILNQTYDNIELICVDDGSNDGSSQIIEDYKRMFADKHFTLKYVYQENAGQAAATNKALKMITGQYLCWIDGDDFLFEDAIAQRVNYLKKHPDYGMVTSDFYLWHEKSGQKERKNNLYGNLSYQTNQFELTMAGEAIIENLAHMVNVELYRKINPELEINQCREGQNYQIILPILYHYKRGFINEPHGCYRIHEDSHCHRKRSFEETIVRYDGLIDMVTNTLLTTGVPRKYTEQLVKGSTFYSEKGRFLDNARN